MIGFLLTSLLIFSEPNAHALTQISGLVRIRGSREPAPEVSVFLLPDKLKATTDNSGRFEFENVESKSVSWVINAPGFKRLTLDETLADGSLQKVFLLERDQTLEYETTITSNENKDTVSKRLSKKEAALTPGAGSDPIRAVQNLPGVNRAQGFSSQVIIQGSAPQDTRYSIDGHEVPLIFHFGGLSSVFNPELIDNFDYLSAGYQSNFGRAMGGIININTRNLAPNSLDKGSVFLDTFNAGAEIESRVGDGELAVGARVSYVGQVLKSVTKNSDDVSLSVAPTYQDLSLIYQTKLSPTLDFKLVGMGSKDKLEFIANNPLDDDPTLRGTFSNQIGFFRLIPELTWKHSKTSESKFSLGLGRDFITTHIGDQFFTLKTWSGTVRAENRTKTSDSLTWVVGTDNRLAVADVGFKLPAFFNQGGLFNPLASSDSKNAQLNGVKANLYGVYLNPIYKPEANSRWTFYPGARFDYFSPISDAKIEPRFGSRYSLTQTLDLTFAGGLYVQSPQEAEYSSAYGNPNIKAPSSWNFKFAAEKDLAETLGRGSQASSGLFAKLLQNLVIPDTASVYSNKGSGKAFGWENSFQYQWDAWNLVVNYTLSRSTRSDPYHPDYLYQYDQTHFLTLIAGVNLPRNWRLSSRYRYVTGPLDTIPTGAVQDLDHDVFIPIRGDLFNTRLDAFSMLDFRADKKWIYDSWTLSLYLDIQNLLNTKNTEGIQYSYDYKTRDTVKGIPILPTFGLKGEF